MVTILGRYAQHERISVVQTGQNESPYKVMTAFDGNVATNSVDAPQVEVHILNNSSNMVRHRQSRVQNNTKVPDFARLLDNIIANSQAETINFLAFTDDAATKNSDFSLLSFNLFSPIQALMSLIQDESLSTARVLSLSILGSKGT